MRFDSLKREEPLGENPAARKARKARLGFDRVSTFAVLSLGGRHGQAHLFANRPRQEAAHGMRLPASKARGFLSLLPMCGLPVLP
jgi:hypothetical protein